MALNTPDRATDLAKLGRGRNGVCQREINLEISEALSGLRGVGLQHECSFIATQDHTGQDSLPDLCADKSHGGYLVSWLSRGWRGDVHERFLHFTSTPLAELPPGLGKLASF